MRVSRWIPAHLFLRAAIIRSLESEREGITVYFLHLPFFSSLIIYLLRLRSLRFTHEVADDNLSILTGERDASR